VAPELQKVNVLVVDDRTENRAALRAMLSEPQYNVVEAGSGPEALRWLLEYEFAALLVDIVMPKMSGFELAELIRKRERTAAVPILFVTAAATDADLVFRGYRAGAVDYLIKPLDGEIVRAKIAVLAQLFRQRKQLEASLREKQILLKEVHHRVKNNLQIITSLLHMQGTQQEAGVRDLLAESEARVRSIALVHESLYRTETLTSIDVDAYLTALMHALTETYGDHNIRTEVISHGVQLPLDTATPFGLIVNELVTNAFKHAYPNERAGTITVSLCEVPPDALLLEVKDDGIGVPPEVDYCKPTTMGLQLVRNLASQLDDRIEIDRSAGTRIRITFPAPHNGRDL
jgi:two-component sensor histidine kinase